ncbi:MAG TPA: hypothetical protein VJ183_14565 [Chloroflexia bacterium]|nr:hypothetical protein [Chloroflexia bacterium]
MISQDILEAITPVVEAFEQLAVPYYIGGSVASSVHGIPRTTLDADIIADLRIEHVQSFVERLDPDYYVDAEMIAKAIERRSSFNVVYLAMILKVDVFIFKGQLFDNEELKRAYPDTLDTTEGVSSRLFYLASPEDTVLRKLEWYKMGGGVSERQWLDVLGVLKLQSKRLDMPYLRRWAAELDVLDLLNRALEDSGLR